jgi:hypothetical protein
MRTYLKRLIWILLLAIAATFAYTHRDQLGLLSNNRMRIRGDWHRVEFDFKQPDVYHFDVRLISKNNEDWGSYVFRHNTRLEITVGGRVTDYELEFPDDDNMVWYTGTGEKRRASIRWRR